MVSFDSIKTTKWYKYTKRVFDFLLSQWMLCLLGVFVGLAYKFPNFAKQHGTIRAEYTISYGAVAVIFLISGLSMLTKDLFKNAMNWRAHFIVLSFSFLITSSIMYGFATWILTSHNPKFDKWMLAGIVVTHACPTTVSSNVVMTKAAHGNDVLTLCEVFIGNLLGGFITPALLQLYMKGQWDFGNPQHQPAGTQSIQALYASTMQQLGCSVFVPIFVGQVVQNVFPKQTKWVLTTFRLSKVGTFMLVLIMWQSFSTAFAQHAFESVSHVSVIFLVFFNIGIYLFFTVICYFYARPIWIKRIFATEPTSESSKLYKWGYILFKPFYWNRRDTVAILLCGPAKTAALGVSLISSQFGSDNPNLGIILVPLVLYQAEQIMTAQILVNFMKKWIHQEDHKKSDEENLLDNTQTKQQDEVQEPETDAQEQDSPKSKLEKGNEDHTNDFSASSISDENK